MGPVPLPDQFPTIMRFIPTLVATTLLLSIFHIGHAGSHPIGGAPSQNDYRHIPMRGEVIRNLHQLREGIKSGVREFYIPSDATIALPAKHLALHLPAGTMIRSRGGMIHVANEGNAHVKGAVISTLGDCLLEGVRLIKQSHGSNNKDQLIGIQSLKGTLRVRHCEITGWSWAGISVKASQAIIEHSTIHHNLHRHLGYGIVVQSGGKAIIRWNIFESNRHSIAGAGDIGDTYLAEYNVQLPGGLRHAFDMHGIRGVAGRKMIVRNNVFAFGGTSWGHEPSFAVRGKPSEGPAVFERNRLQSPQTFIDGGKRHKSAISGPVAIGKSNEFGYKGPMLAVQPNGRLWGDAKFFQEATGYADIDLNGKDDLVRIVNGKAYGSIQGLEEWKALQRIPVIKEPALSADLNGDGKPDGIKLIGVNTYKRPWQN